MSGIEARMFVKGGLDSGVVGALRWPAGGSSWFRGGVGGHDREEPPPVVGARSLEVTPWPVRLCEVSGSAGHSLHNPMGCEPVRSGQTPTSGDSRRVGGGV